MKSNREEAISICLKWEGGYGNDPADAGGPTNYGITIADVRKYVKSSATAQDVKALTKAQAISIYQSKYWKTSFYDCDTLPSGVDLAVFDFGVNSGPSRAANYLKQCKGTPAEVAGQLCDKRAAFIRSANKIAPKFKKGLLNRVADIKKNALRLATKTDTPNHAAGAGVVAGGSVIAVFFKEHWQEILLGSVALAGITWFLIHRYRKVVK